MSRLFARIDANEDRCAWCARQVPIVRVDSPLMMSVWEGLTGETRTWLPFCADNHACILRHGMLMGWATRVGWFGGDR